MAPAELAASGAGVDAITSALAAPAEDVEVDAAEENKMGLREAETDRVLDKSSSNDALHSVTVTSFNDPKLALPENLLKALYEMKFVRPSKIQAAALPKIWAGRNLLAQSHNGTGKTACFVLGMLKVASEEKVPQALCLTPTRELAKQIEDEIRKMGKYLIESGSVAVKCILREERYEKGFKMEQQIICGTAGKVWTLIQMRVIETSKIRVFVLDEADEMLAIGGQVPRRAILPRTSAAQFCRAIRRNSPTRRRLPLQGDQSKRIKQKLNRDVQVLFFSATWTEEVIKFAKQIGGAAENWSQIEVQREHIFNDQTKQMFYRSKGLKEKEGHLKDLLNGTPPRRAQFGAQFGAILSRARASLGSRHRRPVHHLRQHARRRRQARRDAHRRRPPGLVAPREDGQLGARQGAVGLPQRHHQIPHHDEHPLARDRRARRHAGDPVRHADQAGRHRRPRHLPPPRRAHRPLREEGLRPQPRPRRPRDADA